MSEITSIHRGQRLPANSLPVPPPIVPAAIPSPAEWGMLSFLLSEVAFFATLIVAYVMFKGSDSVGPTPTEALSLRLALATTACLLASSLTIHLATHDVRGANGTRFLAWWSITIAFGILFLLGTAYEWYGLIVHEHLTISRNLFGTTFFTLVGFHALHVSAGLVMMCVILALVCRRRIDVQGSVGPHLVSWYWHFVDTVWLIVFVVVYL